MYLSVSIRYTLILIFSTNKKFVLWSFRSSSLNMILLDQNAIESRDLTEYEFILWRHVNKL
jgi:hypothetical protein